MRANRTSAVRLLRKAILDTTGAHASCCALGDATRGHDRTRGVVYDFSCTADPLTEIGPRGLVHSHPELRPADVLSQAAIPGRLAALYVGMSSPECATRGEECRGTHGNKHREAQNIVYKPIVWSTFGWMHGATSDSLTCIAKRIARRHGHSDYRVIFGKMKQTIGVELARRSAGMSLACRPPGRSIASIVSGVAQPPQTPQAS